MKRVPVKIALRVEVVVSAVTVAVAIRIGASRRQIFSLRPPFT